MTIRMLERGARIRMGKLLRKALHSRDGYARDKSLVVVLDDHYPRVFYYWSEGDPGNWYGKPAVFPDEYSFQRIGEMVPSSLKRGSYVFRPREGICRLQNQVVDTGYKMAVLPDEKVFRFRLDTAEEDTRDCVDSINIMCYAADLELEMAEWY